MSPVGKRYPRATMKIFDGTKQEELTVLRFLLPEDADNPFRGPMNINRQFQPRHGLSNSDYKNTIPLLYNREMIDDLDVYASIGDLLNAVFAHEVDTTDRRRPELPETVGRYLYTPALADYLYLAFQSMTTMPILQEKAGEESSGDDNSANSGVEESKREARYDELTPTFATVVRGTPASAYNPPKYDGIIANRYNPLEVDSDSETATHIDDPHKNPFTFDSESEPDTTGVSILGVGGTRNENQKDRTNIIKHRPATAKQDNLFNFDTDSESNTHHDIPKENDPSDVEEEDIYDEVEEFMAHQDMQRAQSKEESSLGLDAEIAYEDKLRYAREGEQYEAEEKQRKDEAEARRANETVIRRQRVVNDRPLPSSIVIENIKNDSDDDDIFTQMQLLANQVARDQEAIITMTTQFAADKECILAHVPILEDKVQRIEQHVKSVTADRVEINVMKKAVLATKKTIKETAAKITTEAN